MKLFYRISIFINIVFACYILVKGSELLTKDLIGAKDVRNAQQSYYKKQSADLEKLDDTLFGEETGSVDENSVPPDGVMQEGTASDVDEKMAQAAAGMQTLTCDTEYEVTVYDETQQTEKSRMETLPASFIGKDRRQVEKLIEDYEKSPSLKDQEEGFVSMSLESFSTEKISVRKVIATSLYYACIVAEDGYLTVYDCNRKQVILYTDIPVFSLPQAVQEEVMDGKYIQTEEELYNLLESYSS